MKPNKRLEKLLAVRVTQEMWNDLEKEATQRRIRVPTLVRMIVSDFLTPKPWRDESRPLRD